MNVADFRRKLAHFLADEFRVGKKSLYWSPNPAAVVTVLPETQTLLGIKSVGVTIAIYRGADRSAWLVKNELPSDQEYAGTNEVGEFGFLFGAEHLLDRPHGHRWSIQDAEHLELSSSHVSQLILNNRQKMKDLAEMLPNRKGFPAGRKALKIPERAWLEIDEPCPWNPCLEQGRRVTAGGIWPEDGTPNYAVSAR